LYDRYGETGWSASGKKWNGTKQQAKLSK